MDPFLLGRSGDGLGFDQNRASTFFGPNMREGLDSVRQKGDPACPVGLPALANVSIPLKGRIKMLKGISRLRKKGVSVKLPCKLSPELDEIRPKRVLSHVHFYFLGDYYACRCPQDDVDRPQ